MSGGLTFSQSRVLFDGLTALVNGGRATLEGEVELSRLAPVRLRVEAALEEVPVAVPAYLPATLSGRVEAAGTPTRPPSPAGSTWSGPGTPPTWTWRAACSSCAAAHPRRPAPTTRGEWLRFDLQLVVDGDVRVENDLVRGPVSGQLTLTGTLASPGLVGTLAMGPGSRAAFRGNEFTLSNAVLELTNPNRMAIALDVHGESQVRDYQVFMHAYGPLETPQLTLTSVPPLPQPDIVTLLSLGFTRRDAAVGTGVGGVATAAAAQALLSSSGLDEQVRRFLPRGGPIRDLSMRITSAYSEQTGQVEPRAEFESRILRDRLRLRFQAPLAGARGRTAQAELRLGERTAVQYQWDSDTPDVPTGDHGVDLKNPVGMERRALMPNDCSRVALVRLVVALAVAAAGPARGAPAPGDAPSVAPAVAPAVPAAPRVASVELQLPAGDNPAAARDLLAIVPGEPLSSRALRRTVQRLFQTGHYRNVIVRAAPAPPPEGSGAWVRLTVEALPVRRLERLALRIDDADVLDASALRAAARLPEGEPFDDQDLEAAAARVRAALARRGRREARVEASATGETAVTASLEVRAGPPTRVSELRLGGDAGAVGPALRSRLRTRPGAVLDEDALAADQRALRAGLYAAGYRRARVGAPEVKVREGRAEVVFPVTAGPRVAFVFRGNASFGASRLERQLGLEEDQPVDAPALDAAADRLRGFYRSRGFAGAQVEVEEVRRGAVVRAVVHVREGARYRLGQVRFEGSEVHDEAWLRARLFEQLLAEGDPPAAEEADAGRALLLSIPGSRPPPEPPPGLAANEFFDEDAWDRAVQAIVDGQRAKGYLEAAQLGTTAALDAARRVVDVTVRLREGPLTLVESISFEGNRADLPGRPGP